MTERVIYLKPTGRPYGHRLLEKKTKVKCGGKEFSAIEKDFWEGPCEPGQEGQWLRGFVIND